MKRVDLPIPDRPEQVSVAKLATLQANTLQTQPCSPRTIIPTGPMCFADFLAFLKRTPLATAQGPDIDIWAEDAYRDAEEYLVRKIHMLPARQAKKALYYLAMHFILTSPFCTLPITTLSGYQSKTGQPGLTSASSVGASVSYQVPDRVSKMGYTEEWLTTTVFGLECLRILEYLKNQIYVTYR